MVLHCIGCWRHCMDTLPGIIPTRRRCGIRSFEFSLNISTLLFLVVAIPHSSLQPDRRMDDDTTFGAAKSSPILWLFKRVLRQCSSGHACTVSSGRKLKCWALYPTYLNAIAIMYHLYYARPLPLPYFYSFHPVVRRVFLKTHLFCVQ